MACQTNPQAVLNCNPVIGWMEKRCTSLVTLADCPLAFEVPPQTPFVRKLITFSMTMCVEQLKVIVYLQSWIHLESLSSLLKFSPHYHHLGTCGYTTCKVHCSFLKVDLFGITFVSKFNQNWCKLFPRFIVPREFYRYQPNLSSIKQSRDFFLQALPMTLTLDIRSWMAIQTL